MPKCDLSKSPAARRLKGAGLGVGSGVGTRSRANDKPAEFMCESVPMGVPVFEAEHSGEKPKPALLDALEGLPGE